MLCVPNSHFPSMTIHKYNGGLSAYAAPWFQNANQCPSRKASSAMLKYFNSLFGVKSLKINNGTKHANTSKYFNPFISTQIIITRSKIKH